MAIPFPLRSYFADVTKRFDCKHRGCKKKHLLLFEDGKCVEHTICTSDAYKRSQIGKGPREFTDLQRMKRNAASKRYRERQRMKKQKAVK